MDMLLTLTSVTIFTLMLSIGIGQSFQDLTSLWRKSRDLLHALIAALVLVPVVVIVLLLVFDLPGAVMTGMAVLAAAPGAPLTRKRSQMAGADVSYVSPLQLALALLAVVVTPLIISLFYAIFDLSIERISPLAVASQVAWVTFVPVIIGLLLQRFAPKLIAVVKKPLNILANVLFIILILAIVAAVALTPELRSMLLIGWPATMAILIMAVAAISIGHFLGGPRPDHRAGLATASLARNIGLALFIVELSPVGAQSIPTLIVYMVVGSVVAIPYAIWIKRQIKAKTE